MKEYSDSIFILNAATNGDPQARKIYSLIVEINEGEQDIKKNYREYSQELKIEILNTLKAWKANRDILIYRYSLQNKKAKTYLDTLKREKREERKVTKNIW